MSRGLGELQRHVIATLASATPKLMMISWCREAVRATDPKTRQVVAPTTMTGELERSELLHAIFGHAAKGEATSLRYQVSNLYRALDSLERRGLVVARHVWLWQADGPFAPHTQLLYRLTPTGLAYANESPPGVKIHSLSAYR